jgi:hypothetical protein
VKHPDTPWYVVCIQAQNPNRRMLSRYQRFTIAVASATEVQRAHRQFSQHRDAWQLRALDELTASERGLGFQCADLNGNWWEICHRV